MPRALRSVLLVISIAAAAFAVTRIWRNLSRAAAVDFYLVWVNAQVAGRDDIPNIYSSDAQSTIGEEFFARSLDAGSLVFHQTASNRRRLDSRGSPFLYASFAWLSATSHSFEDALLQYRVLILAAFAAAILLLGRYCGTPLWVSVLLFALLVHFFLPFRADFAVGNVNALQLFFLALALILSERSPVAAGAVLGLLVAQKPNVILVVVVIVLARVLTHDFRRLRREILGGALGGAFAFAAGSWWFETPRIWLLWLTSAGDLYETLLGVDFNNVTPALVYFERHGTWLSYVLAACLLGIVAVALLRRKRADDLLLMSQGLLIYFMSATLVWLHYLVLCIIPAFALFRSRATAAVGAVSLLLLADVPRELLFGPTNPRMRQPLIVAAMVLLFAACLVQMWRGRESRTLRPSQTAE